MTDDEAIQVVRGQVPYPIIASDMEEAGRLLAAKVERLLPVRDAAQRYSTATQDPGGETEDERRARHMECNQAWRDLNDALARA